MAQQIFISYSSGDQAAADAVCKSLERSGRAPRPAGNIRRPAPGRSGGTAAHARQADQERGLENWVAGTSYGSAQLSGVEWMIDSSLGERGTVRAALQ